MVVRAALIQSPGAARMYHIADFEGFYERDDYTPGDTGPRVFATAAGRRLFLRDRRPGTYQIA